MLDRSRIVARALKVWVDMSADRWQGMMRFAVPPACRLCGVTGGVVLTAHTHGGTAAISWQCRNCERVWPVFSDEQLGERRSGPRDRRARSRTDRRHEPGPVPAPGTKDPEEE